MKIAIIRSSTWLLDPRSYNIQETGLAKGLLPAGISTDIFMAGAVREAETEEVGRAGGVSARLIRLPFHGLPGRQAVFPSLTAHLARGRYDLVQVHDDSQVTSAAVSAWAHKRGIPVVLCQGMYRNYQGAAGVIQSCYDAAVLPGLRKRVTASIAKTSAAKQYLAEKGFDPVFLCPVGLDAGRFETGDGDGRGDRMKHIVYVGMLEKRRNIAFLVDVFAEMVRTRSDVRFSIAGDGPERDLFVKKISAKGLTDSVRYLGRIDQKAVAALYRSADAFLLPSSYEIYGMVILEAMYFGVPVFSTPTAGAVDIIRNGENGFLVDGLHVVEWKRRIEAYLDDSAGAAIRRNARDTVRGRFLWDSACHAYAEVYRQAAGARNG